MSRMSALTASPAFAHVVYEEQLEVNDDANESVLR